MQGKKPGRALMRRMGQPCGYQALNLRQPAQNRIFIPPNAPKGAPGE